MVLQHQGLPDHSLVALQPVLTVGTAFGPKNRDVEFELNVNSQAAKHLLGD